MSRRGVAVSLSVTCAACIGCGTEIATEQRRPIPARTEPPAVVTHTIAVPQTPADREIHRELDAAIAQDTDLRKRHITFRAANGDISVTGRVSSEEERRKVNDLAMNIGGVKSVANALRVED